MSKNHFNFLVISDPHDSIENVRKIVDWSNKNKMLFDYVICCGDIVTIPSGKQDDYSTIQKYEPTITAILEELEKLTKNVIYVPGNHDPKTLFQSPSKSYSKNSINLHKNYIKLDDDLFIVGIGGSTPILSGNNYKIGTIPFQDLDLKKEKYSGYPYNVNSNLSDNYTKSDELLGKDLEETIDKVNSINREAQMIILSHIGPLYTLTNYLISSGENLYLGSQKLGEIFYKAENDDGRIFLNIHGHSHEAKGDIYMKSKKRVFNPGNLSDGNYGIISLKRNSKVWEIESSSLGIL